MTDTSYGRSDDDWEILVQAGLGYLEEQARLERTTSYTEMNTVLARRTGLRPFDFTLENERTAMGHPLYLIVERDRPLSGHMISAIVIYLNENDAGSGFYRLAEHYGVLSPNANEIQRMAFWTSEVSAIHAYYRRRR
jgi:hypothetical protein